MSSPEQDRPANPYAPLIPKAEVQPRLKFWERIEQSRAMQSGREGYVAFAYFTGSIITGVITGCAVGVGLVVADSELQIDAIDGPLLFAANYSPVVGFIYGLTVGMEGVNKVYEMAYNIRRDKGQES